MSGFDEIGTFEPLSKESREPKKCTKIVGWREAPNGSWNYWHMPCGEMLVDGACPEEHLDERP